MVPVDMRGAAEDFDDVEQMTEALGPKGTAEALSKLKNTSMRAVLVHATKTGRHP